MAALDLAIKMLEPESSAKASGPIAASLPPVMPSQRERQKELVSTSYRRPAHARPGETPIRYGCRKLLQKNST